MSRLNHSKFVDKMKRYFECTMDYIIDPRDYLISIFMMSIFESWVYWNCIMLQNVEDAVHIVT